MGISEKYLRDSRPQQLGSSRGIGVPLVESSTVIRAGYGLFWVQLDGNRESEFESVPFLIRESGILNDPFIPTQDDTEFSAGGIVFQSICDLARS